MINVGILGGGQLARMMIPHAPQLGLQITVLDAADCPSAAIAHHHVIGSFRHEEDVLRLRHCHVVTCEIEDVSIAGLRQLQAAGVAVYPSPDVIELIQDKGRQKDFFTQQGLATAPYHKRHLESRADLPAEECFVKLCRGGYDGRGVWNPQKNNAIPTHFQGQDVIIEEKITVERELAQLIARSRDGSIAMGPLVEMMFDPALNLIDCTFMPARASEALMTQAQNMARKIVNALDYVGVMAVEMFQIEGGQLLVNELAPRPHNSGHGTIELCHTDQFEQHLRAVCGLPLGDFHCHQSGATYNLVGQEGYAGESVYSDASALAPIPQAHLHWYGKRECRPGRKMGHLTLQANYEQLPSLKQRIAPWPSARGKNLL